MDRPRVLVAEDRPSVLKLVTAFLKASYDVTTAASGPAALSLIAAESFDVVLTDVRMPGASGFDVLRAVRDRAPRTRVILLTAYANVADAVAAIRLGAYDYVAKPLDAGELQIVVARAVAQLGGPTDDGDDQVATGLAGRLGAGEDPDEILLGFHRAVEEARRRASRKYLVRLMLLHQGNVTQAAKQAGMTRESLHRVLRQFGVRSDEHREAAVPVPESRRAVR